MERTLREWQESYHTTEQYQQTFYVMDSTMQQIHAHNYYITSFSPDKIRLGEQDAKTIYVIYQELAPLDESTTAEKIHQNMYNLAFVQLSIYSEIPTLKPQFVKENIDRFAMFIPEEDFPYYRRMLAQNGQVYYSDYKNAKNQHVINELNKSLEEDSSRQKQGHSLSKATAAGKLYAFPDQKDDMAAFVYCYVLPFIILSLSFLIPFMAWLFALKM